MLILETQVSSRLTLFSIRCRVVQVPKVVEQIIVIIDAIPATRYIFNLSTHSY